MLEIRQSHHRFYGYCGQDRNNVLDQKIVPHIHISGNIRMLVKKAAACLSVMLRLVLSCIRATNAELRLMSTVNFQSSNQNAVIVNLLHSSCGNDDSAVRRCGSP